jgi:hypothetical protein
MSIVLTVILEQNFLLFGYSGAGGIRSHKVEVRSVQGMAMPFEAAEQSSFLCASTIGGAPW